MHLANRTVLCWLPLAAWIVSGVLAATSGWQRHAPYLSFEAGLAGALAALGLLTALRAPRRFPEGAARSSAVWAAATWILLTLNALLVQVRVTDDLLLGGLGLGQAVARSAFRLFSLFAFAIGAVWLTVLPAPPNARDSLGNRG